MRTITIFFAFFFSIINLSAQESNDEYYNPDYKYNEPKKQVSLITPKLKDKLFTNVTFQTGVAKFGKNTLSYSSVNPTVGLAVTPKFHLTLSSSVGYLNAGFNPNSENASFSNKYSTVQTYFQAQADYYANEKLKISASILYGQNRLSFNKDENNFENNSFEAYRVGLEYRINKYMSIGVEVGQTNDYNPFYYQQGGFNNQTFGRHSLFDSPNW